MKRLGFEFFVKGKPQTAWASAVLPPAQLASSLIASGHFSLLPAYVAETKHGKETKEVFLSTYHTKRTFGSAPDLDLGMEVELHAVRTGSASGFAFAYTRPKRGGGGHG